MEHEHATAKAVGTHLEACAIRREWILPNRPTRSSWWIDLCLGEDAPLRIRLLLLVVAVLIIKHDFEHPCRIWKLCRISGVPVGVTIRHAVSVFDALEITVGFAALSCPVSLISARKVNTVGIFFL